MSDPYDFPPLDDLFTKRVEAVSNTPYKTNIRTVDDDAIATATYTPGPYPKRAAIAKRLVLCWNACLGVPDDELRELDEVTD